MSTTTGIDLTLALEVVTGLTGNDLRKFINQSELIFCPPETLLQRTIDYVDDINRDALLRQTSTSAGDYTGP